MPGPLSSMIILYLNSDISMISMLISGSTLASSHASSELSTASFIAISNAFLLLSNPSKCLFFVKNSATEISFCLFASSYAIGVSFSFSSDFACWFAGIFTCFQCENNLKILFYKNQKNNFFKNLMFDELHLQYCPSFEIPSSPLKPLVDIRMGRASEQ